MRIKPVALAFACLFALSAPPAFSGVDATDVHSVDAPASAVSLTNALPASSVFAGLYGADYPALDTLKSSAATHGMVVVAEAKPGEAVKSDVTATAAVAQMGTVSAAENINYPFAATLLMVIAGCFMWLTVMKRREH